MRGERAHSLAHLVGWRAPALAIDGQVENGNTLSTIYMCMRRHRNIHTHTPEHRIAVVPKRFSIREMRDARREQRAEERTKKNKKSKLSPICR